MVCHQVLINPLCRQPRLDRRADKMLPRLAQALPARCGPGERNGLLVRYASWFDMPQHGGSLICSSRSLLTDRSPHSPSDANRPTRQNSFRRRTAITLPLRIRQRRLLRETQSPYRAFMSDKQLLRLLGRCGCCVRGIVGHHQYTQFQIDFRGKTFSERTVLALRSSKFSFRGWKALKLRLAQLIRDAVISIHFVECAVGEDACAASVKLGMHTVDRVLLCTRFQLSLKDANDFLLFPRSFA